MFLLCGFSKLKTKHKPKPNNTKRIGAYLLTLFIVISVFVNKFVTNKPPQTIHINKKSHKYIVVGNKGSNLKSIGESSRREISKFLNKKVNLFLFVKLTNINKS